MKIKRVYRLCALLCVFLISGFDASAGLSAAFKATNITGDSERVGREGFTDVSAYNHEVISPFDPQTGLLSGKRQHRPFKIVKDVTRSSVDFESALVKGQALKTAELRLFRIDPITRQEVHYYSYRFVGVRIVSVRDWMPNNRDPGAESFSYMQEISFTYDTIEWEYVDGGVVATDSWRQLQ